MACSVLCLFYVISFFVCANGLYAFFVHILHTAPSGANIGVYSITSKYDFSSRISCCFCSRWFSTCERGREVTGFFLICCLYVVCMLFVCCSGDFC